MKKSIFIILTLILVSGLLFAGCNSPSTTTTSVPPAPSQKASVPAAPSQTTSVPAAPSQTTSAPVAPSQTTSAPKPTTAATSSTGAQFGGILKVITEPGLTNIGYPGVANAGNDGAYRQPALEELIQYSADGKGALDPWLATDWKYNAEYTTLTFNLRKGVKFHDGTDFNANAAKFSLEMNRTSTMAELQSVASIDVVDDYTIRLNLKSFDAGLLNNLATYQCPIVSPTAIQKLGKDASLLNPVGTGPFKFVSYTRDVLLKYERFNDYWQKPKPYLDGIEISFISDPVVRLASLKAGDGHIARTVSTIDAGPLKASGQFQINQQEIAVVGMIGDSAHSSSFYSNIKVRQAIQYAMDTAAIAKTVGKEFFMPNNQLVSQMSMGYNPDITGYPFNPTKAKQLLAEAGYSKGIDTKVSYTAGVYQTDFFTMIQGYLRNVGINLQLDVADAARYNDLRTNGYTNQLAAIQIPTGADKDMVGIYTGRLASKARYYGSTFVYYPDEYNNLLNSINTERDAAKRFALLKQLGKIAIDDYCIYNPVIVEMQVSAFSNKVHDCEMFRLYPMNFRSENIWLSK
jgi:peptide/nickel transport system substrate-binding protein